MMDTVTDFRRTLEQETLGLTRLCDLWNSKLETDKKIISEEIEVRAGGWGRVSSSELTLRHCRARSGAWWARPDW